MAITNLSNIEENLEIIALHLKNDQEEILTYDDDGYFLLFHDTYREHFGAIESSIIHQGEVVLTNCLQKEIFPEISTIIDTNNFDESKVEKMLEWGKTLQDALIEQNSKIDPDISFGLGVLENMVILDFLTPDDQSVPEILKSFQKNKSMIYEEYANGPGAIIEEMASLECSDPKMLFLHSLIPLKLQLFFVQVIQGSSSLHVDLA
ncbi:hypothetical protein QHL1GM_06125 [Halomonas sp. QHL1]|nr:hypothetical protein QHL1GM_06125 [Halomonas sp. QHL1]